MPEPSGHVSHPSISPWRPLRIAIFRNLLIADLVSDIGTFMQTVGAAWLMTTLTSSSLYVALIQTASALPFFLLALPAGSIGDIFDRRKLILGTETWMLVIATVLTIVTFTGAMTPWVLLLLTLALSLGDAIEAPTWRAIFPELVTKDDLTPALALNGIEFNLARAVGPGLAGLIICGCRRCDNFPAQCAFVFGSDPRHFHLETSHAEEHIADGNARGSQRRGDSVRPLLTGHSHAAAAVGNCHLFRELLLGSSASGRKGTEQERTRVRFSFGLLWSRRCAWSRCPAACQVETFARGHRFVGHGAVRCNSPEYSSPAQSRASPVP